MKKICFKCGEEKSLSSFYKHPMMKDGRVNKCKECNKLDVTENRKNKIEYYKEYDKKRANNPERVLLRESYANTKEGAESHKKAREKWQKNNPIKRGAAQMVNNAVRDNRLTKASICEACHSKPNRLHGHHDDYSQPLIVRWLCPGCHSKWHKENGPGKNAF